MLFTALSGSSSTAGTSDYIQDLYKTGQCKIGENRKAFTLQKLAGLVLHVQKLGGGFLWTGFLWTGGQSSVPKVGVGPMLSSSWQT